MNINDAAEIVRPDLETSTLTGGKLKVVVLGATGMVGQQLVGLLSGHPWFEIVALAASANSAGKKYSEAVHDRWTMDQEIPTDLASMIVKDVQAIDEIAGNADLAFCALNLDKEGVLKLEHAYAVSGLWVTSNNSASRHDPFVPMVIPAVNRDHLDIIPIQRKARGYKTGALMVKSNCSIQSYVIALDPLRDFGLEEVRVHSEQAISGAGKTFKSFPEIEKNLIPLINGEERKSEVEPLKIWGQVSADGIVPAKGPKIKAKCVRVPVPHGHTAYVTAKFRSAPPVEQVLDRWHEFAPHGPLPSAPGRQIHYLVAPDRPQPCLDVMTEDGMAVSVGQLSVDQSENLVSFTGLSHNLILGAAGGAILATEVAIAKGLVYRRV
jgi:aspartate-semialdehyde dehydrogenase